jgi:hypothetical protein
MKIEITKNSLIARAENDREKYYTESALYFVIKKELNKRGYDVIKRCPGKDGHLTSAPYYIRDRKNKFCWIDNNYAIKDLAKDFNNNRIIQLKFESLEN